MFTVQSMRHHFDEFEVPGMYLSRGYSYQADAAKQVYKRIHE